MVIHDFYIFGASLGPSKADSELIVDPNAVLSLSRSLEGLEPILRGHAEVLKHVRLVQLVRLSASHGPEVRRADLLDGPGAGSSTDLALTASAILPNRERRRSHGLVVRDPDHRVNRSGIRSWIWARS